MMSDARKETRLGSLDLLRLISALAVVAFHYLFRGHMGDQPYLNHVSDESAPWAIYGYLGLNLFFMISGYVIAWSAENRSAVSFAVARFARVYPGFIVCMTLTFCVLLFANDPRLPVSFAQFGANLFMFSPFFGQPFVDGVYWTIILELVFYFWIAVTIYAGLFPARKLMLISVWLLISTANEFWLQSNMLRLTLITEYAPFFAGGILAHHIATHPGSRKAIILAFMSYALALANMKGMQHGMLEHYGTALTDSQLIMSGTVLHITFWLAIAARSFIASSALIVMLGGLTYPLYLLHQNIGYVAINAMAPALGPSLSIVLTLSFIMVLSWIIWRFFETPGRRFLTAVFHRWLDKAQKWFRSHDEGPAVGHIKEDQI